MRLATLLLGAALLTGSIARADTVTTDDGAKVLVFFNTLADAITKNAGDCDKLAASATSILDKNAATLKLILDARAAGKTAPPELQAKMMARVKEVAPVIMKCMSNAKVKALVEKVQARVAAPAPAPAK